MFRIGEKFLTMYVIEVSQNGFIGYVYETSIYGNKYLDAPKSLVDAKKWKSFVGAQKNKEKFLKDRPDASGVFQNISIKEIDAQDLAESDVQIQEKKLQSELEHLRRIYSSDSKVEKPMRLKLAELLINCQPGDSLRYYPNLRKLGEFELAKIGQVVGETLWVKGQCFRRIDGFPVDKRAAQGRVLPDDNILSNYLLALSFVQSVEWSDIPVEQVVQVASILQACSAAANV